MPSLDHSAAGALPVRPRIPGAPLLSRASFGPAAGRRPLSVLDAGEARLVTSGRIAIALALREMKVKAGDTVLVPAYHSPSMIPPVLACGAEPRFYRIRSDMSVDLDDIAARLDPSVRVLMVTHYFGFPQPLAALRAFCDARGLLLLEDCAHGFFGEYQGKPFGAWGDYAIASSMKFFPIYEGGCLVSARHPLGQVKLRSAGAGFEAKIALTTLENSFAYGRLPLVAALLRLPLAAKDALWRTLKARRAGASPGANPAAAPGLAPNSSDSSFDFDPRWLDKRSSLFSRAMLRLASGRRIGASRRRHYQALAASAAGLEGIRTLFPALPEGVYPWVFPLLAATAERANALCAALARAGVPHVRFGQTLWPGVDADVCPVSADLSQRLVALPCHQALTAKELDWMIGQLRAASAP